MNWYLWALGSALFAALTAILAKVGMAQVSPNLAMAVRTGVAMALAWLLVMATVPAGSLAALSARNWIFLALSGAATGASWLCYFQALSAGPVARVAAVDKLSVALAAVLAVLFLGERLTLRDGAGIALMVAGAVVMGWK